MEGKEGDENREAERREKQELSGIDKEVLDRLYNLLIDKLQLTWFPPYNMPQTQIVIYALKHKEGVTLGQLANAIAEAQTKTDTGYTIDATLYDRLSDESKKLFEAVTIITQAPEVKKSFLQRLFGR